MPRPRWTKVHYADWFARDTVFSTRMPGMVSPPSSSCLRHLGPIRSRPATLAALLLAMLCSTQPAGAADRKSETPARPAAPLELITTSVAQVLSIVRAHPPGTALTGPRRAEIRRVADAVFDFDEMARRTLAQHWKERTPQEQAEFTRLFATVLERAYLTTITNYPVATVTFHGETVSGSYAQVRSRIVIDRRREIPVEYRLLHGDGGWQVYDVVADGVSLISSYRSQFNTIIRTSSFAELLERMQSREAQLVVPPQGQ